MGRDFCRTLLLYNSISVPQQIADNLLIEIVSLYDHYKLMNETKDILSKDQETEAMKIFIERISKLKEKGTDINSKHIKKALL